MGKNWRDYFGLGGGGSEEVVEDHAEPEIPEAEEGEVAEEVPNTMPNLGKVAQLPGNAGPSGSLEEHSQTWVFVKLWAKEELDKIREKNDTISLNMEKTSANRGKIKMLKDLIKLPETITKQAEKDALKFKNQ